MIANSPGPLWEYTTLMPNAYVERDGANLCMLGLSGWELVGITPRGVYILKRMLSQRALPESDRVAGTDASKRRTR
jgi:hypothetical protein